MEKIAFIPKFISSTASGGLLDQFIETANIICFEFCPTFAKFLQLAQLTSLLT